MFGRSKRQEAIEDVILNEAYGHGIYGAATEDGERFDDMLTRGLRSAHSLGIADPEQASEYAVAYANGYIYKVHEMELEDDLSIDPYTKPKD